MQNPKLSIDCVLLSVPVELFVEAGITDGDLLQLTAEKGRIAITGEPDTTDFVCDGICEDCPINEECKDCEVL